MTRGTVFDDYLDLVEAAKQIGIHPTSLRRLIKTKKFDPSGVYLFAGRYLLSRESVERFKTGYNPKPGRKANLKLPMTT